MTRPVCLTAAAAGGTATDVDAAMDRYGHPACTVHQVLHMTTEASCGTERHCCPDHGRSAL